MVRREGGEKVHAFFHDPRACGTARGPRAQVADSLSRALGSLEEANSAVPRFGPSKKSGQCRTVDRHDRLTGSRPGTSGSRCNFERHGGTCVDGSNFAAGVKRKFPYVPLTLCNCWEEWTGFAEDNRSSASCILTWMDEWSS